MVQLADDRAAKGARTGINVLMTIVWLWLATRIAREHRRRAV